jgi:hypothetical protein
MLLYRHSLQINIGPSQPTTGGFLTTSAKGAQDVSFGTLTNPTKCASLLTHNPVAGDIRACLSAHGAGHFNTFG